MNGDNYKKYLSTIQMNTSICLIRRPNRNSNEILVELKCHKKNHLAELSILKSGD